MSERGDVLAHSSTQGREKPQWLRDRLEWFQDLKLGLIFHWAPYCLWDCCESWPLSPGDEWARSEDMECWTSRGRDLALFQGDYWSLNREFNPVDFDPLAWARVGRQSGIKYVNFTAKHHDGFCMWDTATTDYRVTHESCPFHRDQRSDILKHVFDAFRGQGMGIQCYYSKADWHSQHYWDPSRPVLGRHANTYNDPAAWQRFVDYTRAQIEELMSGYGRIDCLWLDAGWVKGKEDLDMPGLIARARELQPGLIVANRTVGDEFEDFVTPERHVPEEPLGEPWEACVPIADNWKFHPRDRYKPASEIIRHVIQTVALGGNLLLGVGPKPDGTLPEQSVSVLRELGEWLAVAGEAIYGSRPLAPHRVGPGFLTQRAGAVYLIAPEPGNYDLAGLPIRSKRVASLLNHTEAPVHGQSLRVDERLLWPVGPAVFRLT